MNNLKFIGIAIAAFVILAGAAIGWSVIIPSQETVLTEKYDLETMTRSNAYYGKNRPFLLSGTAVLWCNSSFKTFPSLGTVITSNANPSQIDENVTQCQ